MPPKPLKELFWENAEKARMGEFWKDKKSYRELSEATGIPAGSLRMLFMNKPKGNILKIVTITNGLAKVTGKNITLGKLLARNNQHEVFEFQEILIRSPKTCGTTFARSWKSRKIWMRGSQRTHDSLCSLIWYGSNQL